MKTRGARAPHRGRIYWRRDGSRRRADRCCSVGADYTVLWISRSSRRTFTVTSEPAQLLALLGREPVLATARVEIAWAVSLNFVASPRDSARHGPARPGAPSPPPGTGLWDFAAVRSETARLKSRHAADGIDFLGELVDRTGSTWLTGLLASIAMRVQPYNQIVSNVPGPQHPLYVLGARLPQPLPDPPLFERQGLSTAVMSYDGRLFWCMLVDRDVVRDVGELSHEVEAAFEELRAAGSP